MKSNYTLIVLVSFCTMLFLNSCNRMTKNEIFSGNYATLHAGNTIKMILNSENDIVSGHIILNGKEAKIKAKSKDLSFSGTIFDPEVNQEYNIDAIQEGSVLKFSIAIPEPKQTLVFNFEKENPETIATAKVDKERNPALIGTWRYTDVISSGSGEFYASFTTDYFFEFKPDGTVLSWTGKSSAGTRDVNVGSGEGAVNTLGWYTTEKTLHFVDLTNKEESQANFYAEENRVMFSNGNNKRVYERIK
jgi:hypothetical protein